MRKFKNPTNGYVQTCGSNEICGGLLFGVIYLAYRGAWRLALVWLVVLAACLGVFGQPGLMLFGIYQILSAFLIPNELAHKYLVSGYLEITHGDPTSAASPPPPAKSSPQVPSDTGYPVFRVEALR